MSISEANDVLRLRVSENGRYLVDGAGQPFFWLGDTAWRLLCNPTLGEAESYLENRRRKGFNVIQCVIAFGGPQPIGQPTNPSYPDDRCPNWDDELPWIDMDPATPNPKFFESVDRVVSMAGEKRMVIAMFPAWGTFITAGTLNLENAHQYGEWLGRRYRDYPNIVWVLGGDLRGRGYPEHRPEHEDVIRLLAKGLADGDGHGHLRTYHPNSTSSDLFHNDEWLDFNMIQSGHSVDCPNYDKVLADYNRTPVKPILDAEPRYEQMVNGLAKEGMRFDQHQVRKAAYNAVLSGALGHTYGANSVWEFWKPGMWSAWSPAEDWPTAVDYPGAYDMMRMKDLMVSRPWWELAPDPALVVNNIPDNSREHVVAARAPSGSFAYIYVPERKTVAVDLTRMAGERARVAWFDPRTGETMEIGVFATSTGEQPSGEVRPGESRDETGGPGSADPRRFGYVGEIGASGGPEAHRFNSPFGSEGPDYVLVLEVVSTPEP